MIGRLIFTGTAFLLLVPSAWAATPPLTISSPTPAIASSYGAGSSTTITYTLTNHLPFGGIPLSVSGISAPLSRTTVSNDCGNTIPNGSSSCNIGVLIAPTSQDVNKTISQTLQIDYQSRTSLTSQIAFSVSTVPATFVAAGQDNTGTSPPLLAVSQDSGSTFSFPVVTGSPTNGRYTAADCVGIGSSAICAAVGQNSATSAPIISVSNDNGATWRVKSVQGAPSVGVFNGVGCTGSGSSSICVAAGQNTSTNAPIIATSSDGGSTWATKSITSGPATAVLYSASCTGTGSAAICIATGTNSGTGLPMIVVSQDGGNTWTVATVSAFSVNGQLKNTSCLGSGSSAICIAAGTTTTNLPLLAVSTDGGSSWSAKSVTGVSGNANIQAANCIGTSAKSLCLVGGSFSGGSSAPWVGKSTDGGNTWATVTLGNAPASGTVRGISCAGSSVSSAVCAAVGTDSSNSLWLVFSSTDGGATWLNRTINGSPVNGTFRGASCASVGSSVRCIAAGGSSTSQPTIALSQDNSVTWSILSVAGSPSSGNYQTTAGSR